MGFLAGNGYLRYTRVLGLEAVMPCSIKMWTSLSNRRFRGAKGAAAKGSVGRLPDQAKPLGC